MVLSVDSIDIGVVVVVLFDVHSWHFSPRFPAFFVLINIYILSL